MNKKHYTFAFNAAQIVHADGTLTPLPAPGGKVTMPSKSKSAGADKTYRFGDMDFSMTLELPMTDDNKAFFDTLFVEPLPPESAYKLDAKTGQVLVDGRRVSVNGQPLPARWYYVSALDVAIWRWALKTGLQLEDAVAELNWLARHDYMDRQQALERYLKERP